jgi:hypothetical protein
MKSSSAEGSSVPITSFSVGTVSAVPSASTNATGRSISPISVSSTSLSTSQISFSNVGATSSTSVAEAAATGLQASSTTGNLFVS